MSHDLRTPLNGILGFTDLALKEPDPAGKQEYLEKIKLSGDLLLSLVNDTLDLSRIESGKMKLEPEDTDSRSFLQSVIAAVRPTAEQKKSASIRRHGALPLRDDLCRPPEAAEGHPQSAVQRNQIYARGRNGPLFGGEHRVPGSAMTRRITVEDNGIGISPEFLPRLFEPFAQEMRPEAANIQGTGLGLSIVKKIVDLMGGTIEVRSE
jgi:signal transduction histidine kinase